MTFIHVIDTVVRGQSFLVLSEGLRLIKKLGPSKEGKVVSTKLSRRWILAGKAWLM